MIFLTPDSTLKYPFSCPSGTTRKEKVTRARFVHSRNRDAPGVVQSPCPHLRVETGATLTQVFDQLFHTQHDLRAFLSLLLGEVLFHLGLNCSDL